MVNDLQKGALSTRLGIPMIYGIDAVHGHNNVYNATLFPHNVGLGVTRQVYVSRQLLLIDSIFFVAHEGFYSYVELYRCLAHWTCIKLKTLR